MDFVINQLGDVNEIIDHDLLEDIFEEMETLENDEIFHIGIISIQLGKPQVLGYIIKNFKLKKNEIQAFIYALEEYINNEDYEEIIAKQLENCFKCVK